MSSSSLLCRHGDRTPWTGQLCWPNDTSKWFCLLSAAEIPIFSDTEFGQVVPRVYRKGKNGSAGIK